MSFGDGLGIVRIYDRCEFYLSGLDMFWFKMGYVRFGFLISQAWELNALDPGNELVWEGRTVEMEHICISNEGRHLFRHDQRFDIDALKRLQGCKVKANSLSIYIL